MEKKDSHNKKFPARFVKSILAVFFILSALAEGICQQPDSSSSIFKGGTYEKTFITSRIGVGQSVMTIPAKEFHLLIQHRFDEIRGGLYDFFGFDGAVTRFGFEYGFTDWLSAGIGRSLWEKTYDLELKAVILKQNESNMPVSLSYYIESSEITLTHYFPQGHDTFGQRLSIANQLILARNQGILSAQVSPLWLHSAYDIRKGKSLDIFAIDLDGRIRITRMLGIFAEYIDILTDEPFIHKSPLSMGMDINIGGHQFQLIFSNTQGLFEKTYLTNTDGSWAKHIYFGFNLTRDFNRKTD
jgi:hypothetical protein